MRVLIYRQKPSTGAADLAEALDAIRFRGRTLPIERKARRGDVVVSWGEALPVLEAGVRSLNGAPLRTKYQDAVALQAAGVPTITAVLHPTTEVPLPDPAIDAFTRLRELASATADLGTDVRLRGNPILNQGLTELTGAIAEFSRALMYPAPVATLKVWLPRDNHHVGGNDLLTPTTHPDYFVVKENIVKEFRIHSFLGRSIRAGVKALRDGFAAQQENAHLGARELARGGQMASAWIRSWDGGWRIKYDGVSSRRKHRDLAHAAVKALGLDFGAVDIGERADGSLIVLEVNRAPGLKEGTIDVYTQAIQRWIDGETIDEPLTELEPPF